MERVGSRTFVPGAQLARGRGSTRGFGLEALAEGHAAPALLSAPAQRLSWQIWTSENFRVDLASHIIEHHESSSLRYDRIHEQSTPTEYDREARRRQPFAGQAACERALSTDALPDGARATRRYGALCARALATKSLAERGQHGAFRASHCAEAVERLRRAIARRARWSRC